MEESPHLPEMSSEKRDYSELGLREHLVTDIKDHRVGLGSEAVYRAMGQTLAVLEEPRTVHWHERRVTENLKLVRKKMKNLTPERVEKFNAFLNSRPEQPSAWLSEQLGFSKDDTDRNYVGLLTLDVEDDYVVGDTQLLHFLEWHNYVLKQEQQRIEAVAGPEKQLFIDRVNAAIDKGWIPEHVRGYAAERIKATKIALDDGFATSYSRTDMNVAGNAKRIQRKRNEVVIAPGELDEDADKLFTHEFVHVIDGFLEHDRSGAQTRGMYKVFANEYTDAGFILNEAVVEHLADCMDKDGNIDVIDPKAAERKGATYWRNRYLLNVLANMGAHKIDIRDFIAAHFDDGKQFDENGVSPTQKLRESIKSAFPDQRILSRMLKLEWKDQDGLWKFAENVRQNAPKNRMTRTELSEKAKKIGVGTAMGIGIAAVASTALIGAVKVGITIYDNLDTDDTVRGNSTTHEPERSGNYTGYDYYPGYNDSVDTNRRADVSSSDPANTDLPDQSRLVTVQTPRP